jgi:uncharacterized protein YukE
MQAINNAGEVQKFRDELKKLAEDLDNALKETEHEIDNLSQTWRDFEFKKFNEKFEEDKKEIKPLSDKIKEFEGETLLRLQKKIEKYTGGA